MINDRCSSPAQGCIRLGYGHFRWRASPRRIGPAALSPGLGVNAGRSHPDVAGHEEIVERWFRVPPWPAEDRADLLSNVGRSCRNGEPRHLRVRPAEWRSKKASHPEVASFGRRRCPGTESSSADTVFNPLYRNRVTCCSSSLAHVASARCAGHRGIFTHACRPSRALAGPRLRLVRRSRRSSPCSGLVRRANPPAHRRRPAGADGQLRLTRADGGEVAPVVSPGRHGDCGAPAAECRNSRDRTQLGGNRCQISIKARAVGGLGRAAGRRAGDSVVPTARRCHR